MKIGILCRLLNLFRKRTYFCVIDPAKGKDQSAVVQGYKCKDGTFVITRLEVIK